MLPLPVPSRTLEAPRPRRFERSDHAVIDEARRVETAVVRAEKGKQATRESPKYEPAKKGEEQKTAPAPAPGRG